MSAEKTAAEEALIVAALAADEAWNASDANKGGGGLLRKAVEATDVYNTALAAVKQERGA